MLCIHSGIKDAFNLRSLQLLSFGHDKEIARVGVMLRINVEFLITVLQ